MEIQPDGTARVGNIRGRVYGIEGKTAVVDAADFKCGEQKCAICKFNNKGINCRQHKSPMCYIVHALLLEKKSGSKLDTYIIKNEPISNSTIRRFDAAFSFRNVAAIIFNGLVTRDIHAFESEALILSAGGFCQFEFVPVNPNEPMTANCVMTMNIKLRDRLVRTLHQSKTLRYSGGVVSSMPYWYFHNYTPPFKFGDLDYGLCMRAIVRLQCRRKNKPYNKNLVVEPSPLELYAKTREFIEWFYHPDNLGGSWSKNRALRDLTTILEL